MAAIPDTGGAGYAPHGVMRALIRLVVLGALVTIGWLLGSGTSHADEDLGLPGTGLIHLINTATPSADRSGDGLGVPPSVRPAVNNVLSNASVPRLSVQPPVQVGILRPLVNTFGVAKPLTQVLPPVSRPLSGTAPQGAAAQSPMPADPLAAVPATSPAVAAAVPTPAVLTPAVPTAAVPVRTVVPDAAPAVALDAPAQPVTDPMTVPVAIGDAPVTPMPASPLGSTTSPCVTGSTGGPSSTKSASDVAVREGGWATGSLIQSHGLRARDTRDLPGSLPAQPSTSPD